jgi:hypothetical protein
MAARHGNTASGEMRNGRFPILSAQYGKITKTEKSHAKTQRFKTKTGLSRKQPSFVFLRPRRPVAQELYTGTKVGNRDLALALLAPVQNLSSLCVLASLREIFSVCRPGRHKDRSILTEANETNEGLSNAQPNPGRKPFVTFVTFCKNVLCLRGLCDLSVL